MEAFVASEGVRDEARTGGTDAVLLDVEAGEGAVHDERVGEEGASLAVEDGVGEADLADRGVELDHFRQGSGTHLHAQVVVGSSGSSRSSSISISSSSSKSSSSSRSSSISSNRGSKSVK